MLRHLPASMMIYKGGIVYANDAALELVGYNFYELTSFNNTELETGHDKKSLDALLNLCLEAGWHEIDPTLVIPKTRDNMELRIQTDMRYSSYCAENYWVAHLTSVVKIDPQSWRVRNWIPRLFGILNKKTIQRKAKECLDAQFVNDLIKEAIGFPTDTHLVLNLKKTTTIDARALGLLKQLSEGLNDRMTIINARPEVYPTIENYSCNAYTDGQVLLGRKEAA